MIFNVFIFSHQDDEMGVFNHIENIVKKKENIIIFYLTNGSIKNEIDPGSIFYRDLESKKVLNKLGVGSDRIIFLGRQLRIKTYTLHNNLKKPYEYLAKYLKTLDGKVNIYTHSNEGGNIDHDSCFYITKKLFNNLPNITNCYQFSLYNNYKMPLNLYRVMSPLNENGRLIHSHLNLAQKMRYSKLLFTYFSQLHIWLALFPLVIFKIFINKYGFLQSIDNALLIRKPHEGTVWYEKRKFITFNEFEKIVKKFFTED